MSDQRLSPIERKTRWGFSVALCALLVIGIMSVLFLKQTGNDEQWIEHTHDVIEHLQDCFLAEREMGTRAREYVLTGQSQFLGFYQVDLVRLNQSIRTVKELTADNLIQQRRISTELEPLIHLRLAEIATAITLRQQKGEAPAIKILLQDKALDLIEQIRKVIQDMQRDERTLLQNRIASHARSSQRLWNIIILGTAAAIILVGIAALQIHRDFQTRQRIEQDLRDSEARLQRQTQDLLAVNKELESFSYSVSHDLRAPLRGIEGFSKIILEQYKDRLDEEGQGYFNRIRLAAQRMGILIDEILSLSRITRSPLVVKEIDLAALAREAATEIEKSSPARRVKWIIPDSLPVRGDPALLQIVLANLMSNAWKFTEKQAEATIELGHRMEGEEKVYYIRDNGAGFDMTYQSKLFQAFQRLHSMNEFPGSGIGLATVARVIRRHGGRVWAEGKVGSGATFYFTL